MITRCIKSGPHTILETVTFKPILICICCCRYNYGDIESSKLLYICDGVSTSSQRFVTELKNTIMNYYSIIMIIMIIVTCIIPGAFCQQQRFQFGPTSITRCDGGVNVLIPCLYHLPNNPITDISWRINGNDYLQHNNLGNTGIGHFGFIPVINQGLLIPVVTEDMNQLSFQCLYKTVSTGLRSIESSTGILTVVNCNCVGKTLYNIIIIIVHHMHIYSLDTCCLSLSCRT